VVCANLPYIPSAVVPGLPVAASFEPRAALDGGADGLDVIRRLLALLPGRVAADGVALLEIGDEQGPTLRAAAAERLPGWAVRLEPDLAGATRVAVLEPAGDPASPASPPAILPAAPVDPPDPTAPTPVPRS
jgi:release factor glutamine methyltransferase